MVLKKQIVIVWANKLIFNYNQGREFSIEFKLKKWNYYIYLLKYSNLLCFSLKKKIIQVEIYAYKLAKLNKVCNK